MARSRKSKSETADGQETAAAAAPDAENAEVSESLDTPAVSDDFGAIEGNEPDKLVPDADRTEVEAEDSVTEAPDSPVDTDEADEVDTLTAGPVHATEPTPRRGGFLAPVLGGVVAAGLGFGLATYLLPKVWTPGVTAEEIAALTSELKTQGGRIGALSTDVATLSATPAANAEEVAAMETRLADDFSMLREDLNAADEQVTQITAQLGALDNRLGEIEKRPVEGGAASASALEAFGREMDELRKEIEAQRAEAIAAQENIAAMTEKAAARLETAQKDAERQAEMAAESARQTAIRAAIGRLQAALESGGSLEGGLGDLAAIGVDVPTALAEQAHGVPSLAALREAFPPAARAALSASLKEQVDGSMWRRITAFARSQSGARSLTPRAGDDPDAVLSRAEAALGVGDLATAINETATLPADGQSHMAEWIALAERRQVAVDAVAAMAAEYR